MVFPDDDNSRSGPMKNEDWETTVRFYQERIAHLECQLRAIHESYSWRLTWPLRKLGEFLIKFLKNLRTRGHQTFAEPSAAPRGFVQNGKIGFRDLWLVFLRKLLGLGFSMGSALPFRHHLAKYPALQAALNQLVKKMENDADHPKVFVFPKKPYVPILAPEELEMFSRKYGLVQGVHHDLRSPLEAHYAFYRKAE